MKDNKIYEYIARQRCEGAALMARLLAIIGYIAVPALALLIAGSLSVSADVFFAVVVISLGLDTLLIFLSWRFFKVEYESCIAAGRLTVDVIRGSMHRKNGIDIEIRAFSEVGLFTVEASERLEKITLNRDYVFISSLQSENIYYALFLEGDESCALYFETSPEGFAEIKRINSAAVRRAGIPLSQTNKTAQT